MNGLAKYNMFTLQEMLGEIPKYLPQLASLLHTLSPIPREKVSFDVGLLHEPVLRCFVTLSQLSLDTNQVGRVKKWAMVSE
jgi:hypothetical protein